MRQQHPALQFTLYLPPEQALLPAALEVAVYRIVQEAVTNVVRHAQATTCVVRLTVFGGGIAEETTEKARLVLEIIDNGTGIAANQLSDVGLHSMHERSVVLLAFIPVVLKCC